ncbi:MAG TPA: MBL fold metallo-hydrolase [bacterium]|nr:MBL fold metallo-hydrolase [bacterium]
MMRVTLLGTGSSTGTPQLLCDCENCRSTDPRDRRTRFAILLEQGDTVLLVDAPFEIRLQLLAAKVKRLDALWLTHAHSDHLAGVDDLRIFAFRNGAPIPCFALSETIATTRHRFTYLFDDNEYGDLRFLDPRPVEREPLSFRDLTLVPLHHRHGDTAVVSFRTGPFAFLADLSAIDDAELEKLAGISTLVISCTVRHDHYKHLKLDEVLALAARIGAPRTVLTHMNHRFNHADLLATLPQGVEPGYDGLALEF